MGGGLGFTLVERGDLGFTVLDILSIICLRVCGVASSSAQNSGGHSCCQGEEGEMGGGPGDHVGGHKVIGVQSS